MHIESLQKYPVDNVGSLVTLERLCRIVKATYYMRKKDDEFILLHETVAGPVRTGHIIVRNGSLITKTEKTLANHFRRAIPKAKPKPPPLQSLCLF